NYLATAEAIEESEIYTIEKQTLFETLKNNGEFGLKIIEYLASELGFSNTRTVTLTQKHIRGRLAESLIFLKDTYGFEEDDATLKVYLTREDLANLSNMTTSNAIRTLSSFAQENIISLNGRKISILDDQELEKISERG
ncbi:MAG: Crp/Fnr family transcriptional regulator, partial [Bacteroidota bacterium]